MTLLVEKKVFLMFEIQGFFSILEWEGFCSNLKSFFVYCEKFSRRLLGVAGSLSKFGISFSKSSKRSIEIWSPENFSVPKVP
jgi:hypothetical protein